METVTVDKGKLKKLLELYSQSYHAFNISPCQFCPLFINDEDECKGTKTNKKCGVAILENLLDLSIKSGTGDNMTANKLMSVDELVSELLDIQRQGKGHYKIVPVVFDDGEHGHFSGCNKSWLNYVDDDINKVYIGGR